MDAQNQLDIQSTEQSKPQQPAEQTQSVSAEQQQTPEKTKLSELDAQAILAMHGLQASQKREPKIPLRLVIAAVGLIVFVIVVNMLIGSLKPGVNGKSTTTNRGIGIPVQSNISAGSGTTSQINQDVKSCTNPVNAATVC